MNEEKQINDTPMQEENVMTHEEMLALDPFYKFRKKPIW